MMSKFIMFSNEIFATDIVATINVVELIHSDEKGRKYCVEMKFKDSFKYKNFDANINTSRELYLSIGEARERLDSLLSLLNYG